MNTKLTVCALSLAAGLGASAAGTDGPGGEELFARHFAQVGGGEKLRGIRTVIVNGTVREGETTGEFTFQIKEPGMILLTKRDASGKRIRQARDAEGHCWQQDSKGIRDLEPRETGELLALILGFNPSAQLFVGERLAEAISEPDRAWNRPAFATGRKGITHGFMRMWFDSESGLLTGAGHARFGNYRTVDGLKLPHEVRYAGRAIYQVASVRFNDVLVEKDFERPGGRGSLFAQFSTGIVPRTALPSLRSAEGQMEIVRRPPPARMGKAKPTKLPKYDPVSGRNSQVDLRGADLRGLELADCTNDLLHADFDTQTVWPGRMPPGFDPNVILELGKDPGLGARTLHRQGITGKGIGVGIIDTVLLTQHREYADRLRLYEEIHSPAGAQAHMHAAAVASIAVGKTCGMAPDSELYQIGIQNFNIDKNGKLELDYTPIAQGIHRLLDVNQQLPVDRKIRVISISMGWGKDGKGHAEANAAVERAKTENVFVISTSLRQTHSLRFDGLNRDALAQPNDFQSFGPGSWWATLFWSGELRFKPGKRLCVPMDSRTTASPTGAADYVHYADAGWSWAVPWVAGLYALACQVQPDLTPEIFWTEALRTGRTIELRHHGEIIPFGTIADPQALIAALRTPNQDRAQTLAGRAANAGSAGSPN